MYTAKYQPMQGWTDVLSDILPSATQAAGNIVSIFKPQQQVSSYYPTSQIYSGSSAGGLNLNSMLPLLLIGGIAIFAFSRMGK